MLGVAVAATGFGIAALPASGSLTNVTVTLLGGQKVSVNVPAPPCGALPDIQLPGVTTPIVSVGNVNSCEPTATPSPEPSATQTQTPGGSDADKAGAMPSVKQSKSQKKSRGSKAVKDTAEAVVSGGATLPDQVLAEAEKARRKIKTIVPPGRNADGSPTPDNPTFSFALPAPAPLGVPNFFIEKFRIPPFLLPIYQAAGVQYGIRWEVLAAINEIETDYGRNLNVSSAGAVGWMQFLPSTFKRYAVDANDDGVKDPYNPVDAIFSAARYLRAAQADKNLRKAIFAYNHADWYVDSVLLRARMIGGLPADLVGSLTGLTEGRFPVLAKATYADDLDERVALKRVHGKHNPALPVVADAHRDSIDVFSRAGAPVIAVQDAKVVDMGTNGRLGKFISIRDASGNTYTYGDLGSLPKRVNKPVAPKVIKKVSLAQVAQSAAKLPERDPFPSTPASAGRQLRRAVGRIKPLAAALPAKKKARPTVQRTHLEKITQALKPGARIASGTIIGRIGTATRSRMAPHMRFEIRPQGRGAPRIDPKPILDGWKLLESTEVYRAHDQNPFFGAGAAAPTIGQILLMSKDDLQNRVLSDPRIQIYPCGQRDIRVGGIDRRVLATLEFLATAGFKPTVSAMRCGHSKYTTSGNVSEHYSGNAVDISAINGIPILGHQGPGSITDLTVRQLLTLQGAMQPHQIITLMTYKNTTNTFAMADHANHIHVGFRPLYGASTAMAKTLDTVLKPDQWIDLVDRINNIANPTVVAAPLAKVKKSLKKGNATDGD